ncbi:MAG: 2-oxoacid:acceptor oxidoreductase family protein [Actinomycetota bacterium]
MFQVRIHGRGGQGVVTAAELLAQAAFSEGRHAQAFPSFGSERTGAPVVAFCRIADEAIRVREPVMAPDALIVQDETLLHGVDVFNGLLPTGYVLINSTRTFTELGLGQFASATNRFVTVPATELALEHLGRPVPNAVLLGAFAALTQVVSLASVVDAIGAKFKGKLAEGNSAAATAAYVFVQSQLGDQSKESSDAQAG